MKPLRIFAAATLLSGVVWSSGLVLNAAQGATVRNCAPAHLRVSLGAPRGAAGTIFYPIVFTNVGSTACAIWGVPAVQPVIGGTHRSGAPVGPPAHNNSMGEMPVRHVVKPTKTVSAAYGVTASANFTKSACVPRVAGAIVVSMGNFVPRDYLRLRISVCTKLASTHTQLIVAGSTGA
jgi:hypothetical protein